MRAASIKPKLALRSFFTLGADVCEWPIPESTREVWVVVEVVCARDVRDDASASAIVWVFG